MGMEQTGWNSSLDLTAFGLERGSWDVQYFCTPEGAHVFGWPGVDGIHFCTIDAFGEMIFTVSPMNLPGEYVHPVAANFADFLRLLLACGNIAAIEQCWQWTREQFDAFLAEDACNAGNGDAIAELMQQTGLQPIEDVYGYIRQIQASFHYDAIPYSAEYWETVGE